METTLDLTPTTETKKRHFVDSTWLLLIIPCLIFIGHMLLFRTWIVDDAGISFAYARNLAQGHGLVSQPGITPTEGYSNFLWTVLLAPFFRLGAFDVILTPKIISLCMVLATFALIYRTLAVIRNGALIAFVGLTLTALNTSFVVWTTSGLENPLYVLLITFLLWRVTQALAEVNIRFWHLVLLGLVASAIAMTRPDGVVYCAIYPFLTAAIWSFRRHVPFKTLVKKLFIYSSTVVLIFGSYLLLRRVAYGEWVPNTYFAKTNISMLNLLPPEVLAQATVLSKTLSLIVSATGVLGIPFFVIDITMLLGVVITRKFRREHLMLFAFLGAALFVYLYLPPDWMEEARFATPFFLLFYITTFAIFDVFLQSWKLNPTGNRTLLMLSGLATIISSIFLFYPRSTAFAANPTVSFSQVADGYAFRFNKYAQELSIRGGSVLLPDVGGTLYYSHLRVYDLAGLNDKIIAKTLMVNQPDFYNYVFDTIKPTFIHTHGWWAFAAKFDEDSRFREHYLPICESFDPWIKGTFNTTLYSGNFVRKDALPKDYDQLLTKLQSDCETQ
jgi:hypothetical protein